MGKLMTNNIAVDDSPLLMIILTSSKYFSYCKYNKKVSKI